MPAKAIGSPTFRFEAVVSRRLPFEATVHCISCGELFIISLGQVHATYRVGRELVGVCCDRCLSPETYAQLTRLRQQQVGAETAR
jgi:hypothetical protein